MRRIASLITSSALLATLFVAGVPAAAGAASCTPTGFYRDNMNLTAAQIGGTVTGTLDATGCNIGAYFDASHPGSVQNAEIFGANYFGVVANGGNVDVTDSSIHDIGESPLNGDQHGVGVYYAYGAAATGTVSGTDIRNYQKGGIVANGLGTDVAIRDNVVTGQGPVAYIAQNGIQVGYGATASVTGNTVTGNSYTGTSTVSGGIIVVGGPCYGPGTPYTTGTQIVGNTVMGNDVGIWLTNIQADCLSAPTAPTNVKAVNNTVSNDALHNDYGGFGYQAGIADQGDNDKIVNNTISGDGYLNCGATAYCVAIDADSSFTNNVKIHANTIS